MKLYQLKISLLSLFLFIGSQAISQIKFPVSKETRKITYEGEAESGLKSIDNNVNKIVGWITLNGYPLSSIKITDQGNAKKIVSKNHFPAYYILKTSVDARMEEKVTKGNYYYFVNKGEEYGQIRYDLEVIVYDGHVTYKATNFEHYYPNRTTLTCGPLEPNMGKNTTKDYWIGYKLQTASYMNWFNETGFEQLLSLAL